MKQVIKFAESFGISIGEAEKGLRYHASKLGGCVTCKHSLPSKWKLSWLTRSCPFGMRQEDCTQFEPIE